MLGVLPEIPKPSPGNKPALNPSFSPVLHYVFLKWHLLVFAKSGFTLYYKLSTLNILLLHASRGLLMDLPEPSAVAVMNITNSSKKKKKMKQ